MKSIVQALQKAHVIDRASTVGGAVLAALQASNIDWNKIIAKDPAELGKLETALATLAIGFLFNKQFGKK